MDATRLMASLDQFVVFMDTEVHDALEAALNRAVDIAKDSKFLDHTRDLRDNIRFTLDGHCSDDTLLGTFGAYSEHATYVEDDTVPHKITAKGNGKLQIPIPGGGFYYRKSVNHPGTKGFHFMLAATQSVDMPAILDLAIERAMQKAGLS